MAEKTVKDNRRDAPSRLTNVTINWRGKEGQRGIAIKAIQTLKKLEAFNAAEHLSHALKTLIEDSKGMATAAIEIELTKKFVIVRE